MTEVTAKTHRREKAKIYVEKAGRLLASTALCYSAGATSMNTFGQTETEIGPITAHAGLKIKPDDPFHFGLSGGSEIGINDINRTYDTHEFGPTVLLEPRDVDLQRLRKQYLPSVNDADAKIPSIHADISNDLEQLENNKGEIISRSVLFFLAGSVAAGGLMLASSERKKIKDVITSAPAVGAASGAMIFGGGLIGLASYDATNLSAPKQTGTAAEAELLVDNAGKLSAANDKYLDNGLSFLSIANQIEQNAKRENYEPKPTLRVVIKSDEHLTDDSTLVEMEQERSRMDDVDLGAIMSGGDLTDFGTPDELQARLFKRMPYLDGEIPTYIVGGNHDSERVMDELSKLKSTEVAGIRRGQIVEWNIKGARVLAVSAPEYTPDKSFDTPETELQYDALREAVTIKLKDAIESGRPYDILMTHNPLLFDGLDTSLTQGLIAGHTHQLKIDIPMRGAWYINPGSSSAGGLRAMNTDKSRSYAVANFDSSCQLISVEVVEFPRIGSDDDEIKLTTIRNQQYKPEENTSQRCAADD